MILEMLGVFWTYIRFVHPRLTWKIVPIFENGNSVSIQKRKFPLSD